MLSACRQSNSIQCYDVRNTQKILFEIERKGLSNQRMAFHLFNHGNCLVTGDQFGRATVYDVSHTNDQLLNRCLLQFQCHNSHFYFILGSLGSTVFNPIYSDILATCSGHRTFSQEETSDNYVTLWRMKGQWK